jgi:chemotaxis protein MotB
MSRKKHPEHVNHERWLVSYADFITLLFAFFVVLFASGQSDKHKQTQMASAMQTAFNPTALFAVHAKKPSVTDNMGTQSAPIITPAVIPSTDTAKQIESRIGKVLAEQVKNGGVPPAASLCAPPSKAQ